MEQEKLVVNSQSLLARLLATENIKVRHRAKVTTAHFDLKYRELVLPLWKNISPDLYDMLVIHEVGHALETPGQAWHDAIFENSNKIIQSNSYQFKSYLNIIEDTRIDRLQKRRYPGSKRSYVRGYAELWDRDFFQLKERGITVDKLDLIDRINCFYKNGAAMNIPFTDAERKILEKIDTLETFEQVVDMATKLFLAAGFKKAKSKNKKTPLYWDDEDIGEEGTIEGFFKKLAEELKEVIGKDGVKKEGGLELSFDFILPETKAEESADDEISDREIESVRKEYEREETLIEDEVDKEKNDRALEETAKVEVEDDDDRWYPPGGSMTNNAYEEAMEEMSDAYSNDDKNAPTYVTFPKFNLEYIVDDYPKVLDDWKFVYDKYGKDYKATIVRNINDFKTDENASISYMVKEFQLKKAAQDYSKVTITKSGVLNTNKLHSYKYNDDIFKKIYNQPTGKNHGFVIFLDWSGSMAEKIFDTFKQLMSITYFCKRVQIPFDIYIFRSINSREYVEAKNQFEYRDSDIRFEAFKIRNILSSRMSAFEFNLATQYLWSLVLNSRSAWGGGGGGFAQYDAMKSTPLNQTIYVADKIVNDFKRKNNLEVVNSIFMTDGGSDQFSYGTGLRFSGYSTVVYEDDYNGNTQFTVEGSSDYYDNKTTTMLYRRFKTLTQSNLIGFYLFDGGTQSMISQFFPEERYNNPQYDKKPRTLIKAASPGWEKLRNQYEEEGFVTVLNKGYDEYYIIQSTYLKLEKDDLKVKESQSKDVKVKQFLKYSSKKRSNRVLLNRFIKLVSTASA